MAVIKVTVESNNFGKQVTKWTVPDLLERPYMVAIVAGLAKLFVAVSAAVSGAGGDDEQAAVAVLETAK